MAMMDDRDFLISHIRNSFITSDDTGMCEVIIMDNDDTVGSGEKQNSGAEKRPTTWPARNPELGVSLSDGMDSDIELAHSYDIVPDMDFASHRRRSNTAQRLEKLKREKHKQSKIKHIPWKDVEHTAEEIGENFEKKAVSPRVEGKSHKSCLSLQIEQFAAIPNNPFMEYAKFDGKGQAGGGVPTKKIDIYLTMAEPKDRPFPMQVITVATAKVSELIGLICWQYSSESRTPTLNENLEVYSLHIAEDDGEVDMDFPALDSREPISKFGFAKLALVEKELPKSAPQLSVVVTINMPNRGFTKLTLENDSTIMREIFEKVLTRRKIKDGEFRGLKYMLEKQREPGTTIDLDSPLSSMGTLEFCMVRENSVRGDVVEEIPDTKCDMAESLTSHQYKSYIVDMIHKLRTSTEVQLGISGEKIEIDPVAGKTFLFKEKAITHLTDDIAICSIQNERSSGRASFQIVYHSAGHEFKHHYFESDRDTAKQIVQKVNNILELRSSPVRKDYKAYKERKKQKKPSLPSKLNSLLNSP